MPTIMEVGEPPSDHQVTERTSNISNKERRLILPPFALPKRKKKSRKVNSILIGSKHNSVKNGSRRRIQMLIEMQNASNRIEKLREPIEKLYAKCRRIGKRLNSMLQIQNDLRRHHFKSRKKKKKKSPPYEDRAVSNNSSRYDFNR